MADYFALVKLTFEKPVKRKELFSEEYLGNNIRFALKGLFGEVGCAIPFQILKIYDDFTFVLGCPFGQAVKLQASLTLQGTFQGERCAYHFVKYGSSLLELV